MRVEPFVPDLPVAGVRSEDAAGFARALDALGGTLHGATRAENDFAYGRGTLEAAVYERARADVAIAVATSTVSHVAQAVQSVLNMQV
ncbi:MAG TPA: hypothetical protein VEW74_00815 [Candidatus Nitrosotalea sp.]|nr:hypothetical protein [Candidatus Nitrosotalea sp.]